VTQRDHIKATGGHAREQNGSSLASVPEFVKKLCCKIPRRDLRDFLRERDDVLVGNSVEVCCSRLICALTLFES